MKLARVLAGQPPTPIQWGIFSSYFAVQEASRNMINGNDTPTELDRGGSAQPFRDA